MLSWRDHRWPGRYSSKWLTVSPVSMATHTDHRTQHYSHANVGPLCHSHSPAPAPLATPFSSLGLRRTQRNPGPVPMPCSFSDLRTQACLAPRLISRELMSKKYNYIVQKVVIHTIEKSQFQSSTFFVSLIQMYVNCLCLYTNTLSSEVITHSHSLRTPVLNADSLSIPQ